MTNVNSPASPNKGGATYTVLTDAGIGGAA
jgi:hypothetical protein